MRITGQIAVAAALLLSAAVAGPAAAGEGIVVKSSAARPFAALPDDLAFPEGITANPGNGDVIVGTFGAASGTLLRYDRRGHLIARADVGPPILGLAYNSDDGKVYYTSVGDFVGGASSVRRIDADFVDASSDEHVAEIPGIGAPANLIVPNPDTSTDEIAFGDFARVPNALAFNSDGDLYVSDSFQGAVFVIGTAAASCPGLGCIVDTVAHDGRLATVGFPPFGANGLALNADETELFVANTGDDRVLRIDLASSDISPFAESINGADGLAMDGHGNLWVAANQADNVVVLNSVGRVIARLGAFLGIRKDGSADGLIFPASLVIVGKNVYVTNLARALRGLGAGGAEPEAGITRYTVSRIRTTDIH